MRDGSDDPIGGGQRSASVRDGLRCRAGKDLSGLAADHHTAVGRREANDQTHIGHGPTRSVPGNPNTVGMAQLRFAIVRGKLLRCIDVLSSRLDIAFVPVGFVERIDDQRPFNLDRSGLVAIVEHDPAAEPARRRPIGMVQHGVRPHGREFGRNLRLFRHPGRPPTRLVHVELGTTGYQCHDGKRREAQKSIRGKHGNSFHPEL